MQGVIKMDIVSVLLCMGVPSAITGLAFWGLERRIEKREKERQEQERAREKQQLLLVKSVRAAIALGEATAIALRDGKTNGETRAALDYAREIKHEQKDFLAEQGIKNLF